MKILLIFLSLWLLNINLRAQFPEFDDLIEFEDSTRIKMYIDGVYKIVYKDCADYYVVALFDRNQFIFKDTLKIYRLNGELLQECSYSNGLKEGNYISYFKNGQIEILGEYKNGMRNGIWKYYYSNGQLYKTIEFKNKTEYLINFYLKNGKALVKDGYGKYKDEINMSISSNDYSLIKGKVKNGAPDGKWTITTSGNTIATEYFKNDYFIKGISHSIMLGDEEYTDLYMSTFSGIIFIEQLKLIGPSVCQSKGDLILSDEFFEKLKNNYKNSSVSKCIFNDWLLVELESNNKKQIKNVKIFSNINEKYKNELAELIYAIGNIPENQMPQARYKYFPIVIQDSIMYLPGDKEIELLKFKF